MENGTLAVRMYRIIGCPTRTQLGYNFTEQLAKTIH